MADIKRLRGSLEAATAEADRLRGQLAAAEADRDARLAAAAEAAEARLAEVRDTHARCTKELAASHEAVLHAAKQASGWRPCKANAQRTCVIQYAYSALYTLMKALWRRLGNGIRRPTGRCTAACASRAVCTASFGMTFEHQISLFLF